MKLYKLFLSLWFLFIFISCEKSQETLTGTYGLADYFSLGNDHVCYAEPFLLEIKDSTAIAYGTVLMNGSRKPFKRKGDTLILNANTKFYKRNSGNEYILETKRDGVVKTESFRIYNGLEKIISEGKIDFEKLTSYQNEHLISGTYTMAGNEVIFGADGMVKGLDEFRHYKLMPRRGTLTWYDNCVIETDKKDIWKYEFLNDELILTKYTEQRDEWEHYILSNIKLRLKRK